MGFPQSGINLPELEPIIESWRISARMHEMRAGATDEQIAEAERLLGRNLPSAMKALYKISNGLYLLEGNITIFDLGTDSQEDLTLVTCSEKMREWEWAVPDEVVLFGGDGSEGSFGVWLPAGGSDSGPHPIIEVAMDGLAVAGTDICRFLRSRTALYTMAYVQEGDLPADALSVMGFPAELMDIGDEWELLEAIHKWADPAIPDPVPDPYDRPVTVEQLRSLYAPNQ